MKAIIKIDLKTSSPAGGQQFLFGVCDRMMQDGEIDEYSFEIETEEGSVTERCVLSEERVIA